ncbi:PTS cellbiose transporter subunit IIB, partial [Listeria monocytogenes]|nr:PTS cellbiose transporter subunit IIB [Listeria monocytogenes]
EIFMVGNDYDFLILAPQTRFNQAKVAAAFPDKKIVLLTDEEFLSKNVARIVEEIKI